MAESLPKGFRFAGVHSGVKEDAGKPDLSLIATDPLATGVGVFTQNVVCGAPVQLNRTRTPSDAIVGVVINSGVSNACTGERGYLDAKKMASAAAKALRCREDQVLVMSTGVIGQMLPMDKILPGIETAVTQLQADEASFVQAARGMMTTDTRPKYASRCAAIGDVETSIAGVAKGAAMIGPNMATMLAVVMTDANLSIADASILLKDAVDESFNCISVEGHTSTSDTVLLLANGAAGGGKLTGRELAMFRATLVEVCEDLAQSIPADGEGASHMITIEVHGCRSRTDATTIARTVADSPLVKTAIAGNDPNWGRIVSAAGYSGVKFDAAKVSLHINGSLLYERGSPVAFDDQTVSESMAANYEVGLVLLLDEGDASARFWTSDLTAEYVRLNADYRT